MKIQPRESEKVQSVFSSETFIIAIAMLRLAQTKLLIKKKELLEENGLKHFHDFMNFSKGESVTRKRGRTVVRFEIDHNGYYLKRNRFSYIEFLKNLARFQIPSLNATKEWENIASLHEIGIESASSVAMGEKRILGIEIASFILTEEISEALPLEKIIQDSQRSETRQVLREKKRRLIPGVAKLTRNLHQNGMYHQDFYLGHIFLGKNDNLYLIDLQRLKRKKKVPQRYIVKDLAQLNYSAETTGNISSTDRMRFYLLYLGKNKLGRDEKKLARQILLKTTRISKHTVKLLKRRRKRREIA